MEYTAESAVSRVRETRDGDEALELALNLRPDALFLDVEMPGLHGTEVARRLTAPCPGLVFVTAHPVHAVDAFAAGAVHYLLKPASRPLLAQALARLRPESEREWLRIPVRRRETVRFLHPANVDALVADLGDCQAWTAEGKLRVEGTLAHWEERLEAILVLEAGTRLVLSSGLLERAGAALDALRGALGHCGF